MKYLNPDGFSVAAVSSQQYRDNWEATFGEKDPTPSERARLEVIEMCPSNECQIRQTCTRVTCVLRPPLDEIAQGK